MPSPSRTDKRLNWDESAPYLVSKDGIQSLSGVSPIPRQVN